jgi:hypothetical protein
MQDDGLIVCELRPCLPKWPENSARMRTIVTAALQRHIFANGAHFVYTPRILEIPLDLLGLTEEDRLVDSKTASRWCATVDIIDFLDFCVLEYRLIAKTQQSRTLLVSRSSFMLWRRINFSTDGSISEEGSVSTFRLEICERSYRHEDGDCPTLKTTIEIITPWRP